MEITEIKIVEMGVSVEIRITVNGLRFYSHCNFDNATEAREFLNSHGLQETKRGKTED